MLHHYDVAINPDKCPRRVNREIIDALVKMKTEYFENERPVFDGRKNLYSVKPLPGIGRDRVRTDIMVMVLISLSLLRWRYQFLLEAKMETEREYSRYVFITDWHCIEFHIVRNATLHQCNSSIM